MRIGIGYDAHALVRGRPLILGGVEFDHELGLAGHSDADVLVHALMDAILSAMREGDIGRMFPDSEPAYENADSLELLRQVSAVLADRGWMLEDADCVLVCERPKISPFRDTMRRNIAEALGIDMESIGVKATTTEGLGFEGREDGIGAYAVVLLRRA